METISREYFDFLLKYKFIVDVEDDHWRMNPAFYTILKSQFEQQTSIMRALMLAVESWEPTFSDLQKSVVCSFVSKIIQDVAPVMFKKLLLEMEWNNSVAKSEGVESESVSLGEAMKRIKEENNQK